MRDPRERQACTECGLDDSALIHHATANGHAFAADRLDCRSSTQA